jgi:hypothetical protein
MGPRRLPPASARGHIARFLRRFKEWIRTKKAVAYIKHSGAVDSAWYLKRYPDVAASGMDPALHYLRFGAEEGRQPRADLGTASYRPSPTDPACKGEDALSRYLADFSTPRHGERLAGAFQAIEAITEPLVSIVIPYCDAEEFFGEALQSARQQTLRAYEIIIVDDGSRVPLDRRIEQSAAWSRIRVFRQDHKGPASARNEGARRAQGQFVYFLDADDLIEPTTLEKLWLLARARPDDDFYYSGVAHFGGLEAVFIDEWDAERLKRDNFLPASALIRLSSYWRAGGMDEAFGRNNEDHEFGLRLSSMGGQGRLFPEPLFKRRRRFLSGSSDTIASRDGTATEKGGS